MAFGYQQQSFPFSRMHSLSRDSNSPSFHLIGLTSFNICNLVVVEIHHSFPYSCIALFPLQHRYPTSLFFFFDSASVTYDSSDNYNQRSGCHRCSSQIYHHLHITFCISILLRQGIFCSVWNILSFYFRICIVASNFLYNSVSNTINYNKAFQNFQCRNHSERIC